jgi:hypothetical protein
LTWHKNANWNRTVHGVDNARRQGLVVAHIVATSEGTQAGDWLGITAPVLEKAVPLNQSVPSDARTAVAWQNAFLFPCLRQPRLPLRLALPRIRSAGELFTVPRRSARGLSQ